MSATTIAARRGHDQPGYRTVRIILVIGALGMFVLSAIFAWRLPLVGVLWPWSDGPLSYYFLAAMQAAIGAAMLWIGLSGELAALAPGALNLVVMMAGSAITFFAIGVAEDNPTLIGYAIGCLLFAIFNGWLYLWARRIPFQDNQPLPGLLRASYVLFVLVLAGVGLALLMGRQGILPWTFGENNRYTPLFLGWMFFGDAFYFLYAVLNPRWRAACAQLCSFLAYDLVLLGPFLIRWPVVRDLEPFAEIRRVPDGLIDNLIVYSLVLIYSGALGVYYLLIHRRTRLFGRGS
jgi:hypothetical protein